MPPPAPKRNTLYLSCVGKSQEVIGIEKKKMGRPTDNPRPNKLSIRISDGDKALLEAYCEALKINRTEAVSRAIEKLRPDLENKQKEAEVSP